MSLNHSSVNLDLRGIWGSVWLPSCSLPRYYSIMMSSISDLHCMTFKNTPSTLVKKGFYHGKINILSNSASNHPLWLVYSLEWPFGSNYFRKYWENASRQLDTFTYAPQPNCINQSSFTFPNVGSIWMLNRATSQCRSTGWGPRPGDPLKTFPHLRTPRQAPS